LAENSAIEWTDATWNVSTGCTKVSPACANCYIERTPPFRIAGRRFVNGHIPLKLHQDRLTWPSGWRKPRRVFVDSLSDLFHADVPDAFLHRVYHAMEGARQHQYQVLTKRPERLRDYLAWRYGPRDDGGYRMPARHIWHGTSVENRAFLWRIDALREARSAVRFLSIEPLLGDLGELNLTGIHWVIVGAESGPRVRPTRPEWVRAIRDQCIAAGVAFFFKQWGGRTSKAGGRMLDGREWSQFPASVSREQEPV
jgi:protein gp37